MTIYEKASGGNIINRDYSNRVLYSFREGSWVPGPKVFISNENFRPYHFIVDENPYMSPKSTDQRKTIFLEQAEHWEWE
jgi:hypothetical protein